MVLVKCKEEIMTDPINMKEHLTKHQQLERWLTELCFPADRKTLINESAGHGGPGEIYREFSFFTNDHEYVIHAKDVDGEEGYLGCQVLTRKPRAGESWTRGNDLPDGPFNRETWYKIIFGIVRYELVKLSKYNKPEGIPEDSIA
jgi:hypothetical protein